MDLRLEELKRNVKERVIASLDFSKDITDREMYSLIDKELSGSFKDLAISVSDRKELRNLVFHSIRKLDVLQQLIDDPSITEIMVNGTDSIFIEKDGRLFRFNGRFESREKLEDVVQQIVASCNRVVNEASPIVDARLENGARVNIVLNPVALSGPVITIRRFPDEPITMDRLLELGFIIFQILETGYF